MTYTYKCVRYGCSFRVTTDGDMCPYCKKKQTDRLNKQKRAKK